MLHIAHQRGPVLAISAVSTGCKRRADDHPADTNVLVRRTLSLIPSTLSVYCESDRCLDFVWSVLCKLERLTPVDDIHVVGRS